MNIFITRYINKDKDHSYLSCLSDETYEEAVASAETAVKGWNDGTTYEIIEYTPILRSKRTYSFQSEKT